MRIIQFNFFHGIIKMDMTVVLPVRASGLAEWGTIAASWGMEPISGSGVLLGGELASGDITILGFSYNHTHTHAHTMVFQYSCKTVFMLY